MSSNTISSTTQLEINPASKIRNPILLAFAWGAMLIVSTLPTILWNELGGGAPDWLFWAKVGFTGLLVLVTFLWTTIRPLRMFLITINVLYLAEWGFTSIGQTPVWINLFGSQNTPFTLSMLGTQLLRLCVALVMVVYLWAFKHNRRGFFLVKGQTDATAAPIPLIMSRPTSWSKLGPILCLCVSLGLLVFLVIAGRPSLSVLGIAIPLLPAVLLLAGMNAFSEEMNYRASFLSTLPGDIGSNQSLLITASYFGIGHYYGVPYGMIGVLMAGLLGWLLGKSMLETKGFFWAWLIHFIQDVLIFSFMAIGSVTPGGR
jgi:uncharacterized protein